MFIKFVSDRKECIVETSSYSVSKGETENSKILVVNQVKADVDNTQLSPTEFLLLNDGKHYVTAFIMNNDGKTIDRITVM